jgi:hypothetical protein
MASFRIKKASDIIDSLFIDFKALSMKNSSTMLISVWQDLAGEKLASHSKIVEIKAGRVSIEVDHPGWIQIFRVSEKRIMQKCRQKYPDLDILSFSFIVSNR